MSGTKTEILAAARARYVREGFAFTLRALAEDVGITAAALYRHFDDKEALFAALFDDSFRRFGEAQLRAAEAAGPRERMQAAGRAYLDFALAHPADYRLMFMAPADLGERLPEHIRQRARGVFRLLVDRVRENIEAGHLPAGLDPEHAARAIWALSHGLVSLHLAGKLPGGEAELRQAFRSAHGWLAVGIRTASSDGG
jgi:AcrR family transcriptional regulator